MAFLKSKDENDGTEQALLDELKALDEHLKNNVCFMKFPSLLIIKIQDYFFVLFCLYK